MPSFHAVYVRGVTDDRLAASFAERFPRARAVLSRTDGSAWVQLGALEGAEPESVAAGLSAALGCPALSLVSQSAVDHVELHLFAEGLEERHLSYTGGGDGWEVVRGRPQPWEAALFGADEPDGSDADRRAQATRTLVPGARVPRITAFHVVEAMELPGSGSPTGGPAPRPIGAPGLALRRWAGPALVAVFLAVLVVDVLYLPRASWRSTAIFGVQAALFLAAAGRLAASEVRFGRPERRE
jgi:hypothetical protein